MKKNWSRGWKKLSYPHFHTNVKKIKNCPCPRAWPQPYLYVQKVTKKLLPSPCSTSTEIRMSKNKQKNFFRNTRFVEIFLKYMTRQKIIFLTHLKNFWSHIKKLQLSQNRFTEKKLLLSPRSTSTKIVCQDERNVLCVLKIDSQKKIAPIPTLDLNHNGMLKNWQKNEIDYQRK